MKNKEEEGGQIEEEEKKENRVESFDMAPWGNKKDGLGAGEAPS